MLGTHGDNAQQQRLPPPGNPGRLVRTTPLNAPHPSRAPPPPKETNVPAPPPLPRLIPVEPEAAPRTHRLLDAVVAATSGKLTSDEALRALLINEAGLARGTTRTHAAAWELWLDFQRSRCNHSDRTPVRDPFLLDHDPQEVSMMFTLWAEWLREEKKLSNDKISTTTSNLKSNWITANLGNRFAAGRNQDEARRTAKAFKPTAAEVRMKLKKARESQIFPTADGMVSGLRQDHFLDLLADADSAAALDKMGAYMGVAMTLETAQRGCQWFFKQDNHAMLTGDVRFQWGVGNPDEEGGFSSVTEVVGEKIKPLLRGGGALEDMEKNLARIVQIKLDFLTGKTGTPQPNFILSRRTEEEKNITEDMGRWICLSDTKDKDVFISRYAAPKNGGEKKNRRITPKEGTALVKLAARRANLPEKHFALSSLRPAGTTAASRDGATTEEIRAVTGHAKNSQVVNTHYNYDRPSSHGGRGEAVGTSVRRKGGAFSVEELRRIMPLRGSTNKREPSPGAAPNTSAAATVEEPPSEEATVEAAAPKARALKRTRAAGTPKGPQPDGKRISKSGRTLKTPSVLSYDSMATPARR